MTLSTIKTWAMTLFTVIKMWTFVLVSTILIFLVLTWLPARGYSVGVGCNRGLDAPQEQEDGYSLDRPPPIERTTWAWFRPEVPLYDTDTINLRMGVPLIWFERDQLAHGCSDPWRIYTRFYAEPFIIDLIVAAAISATGYWLSSITLKRKSSMELS